jgi:hypothetical protein
MNNNEFLAVWWQYSGNINSAMTMYNMNSAVTVQWVENDVGMCNSDYD